MVLTKKNCAATHIYRKENLLEREKPRKENLLKLRKVFLSPSQEGFQSGKKKVPMRLESTGEASFYQGEALPKKGRRIGLLVEWSPRLFSRRKTFKQ